ncbi:MAG: glycosyltransferase family 39 protein [Chloroflexi bacterium]|nr:glycosyltransferase family 39 protein [Chloroflexota bacterium]
MVALARSQPVGRRATAGARPSLLRLAALGVVVAGLAAWVASAKLSDLLISYGPDQGMFSLEGIAILRGQMPYRDVWDNKPPGLYYTYAAVLAWFPAATSDCTPAFLYVPPDAIGVSCGYLGVMALDALFTLGVAVAVFAAGRTILGSTAQGALAAALCLVFAVQRPLSHGGGKPELLMLLPEALAYVVLWHAVQRGQPRLLALSGVCLGLAFLFKQTAIAAGASMLVLLALRAASMHRRRVAVLARDITWLGVGALAVTLPIALYLAANGALDEMLYAVFGFGWDYVQGAVAPFLAAASSNSWQLFRDSQGLLWLLALVGVAQFVPRVRQSQAARLLCLWALGDAAAVAMGGGRFFPYYYVQLVPSFALLAAHGLGRLWQRAAWAQEGGSSRRVTAQRAWLVASLAMVFSLSISAPVHFGLRALYERAVHWVPSEAERAAWAVRQVPPGTLLVWGEASHIYVLAGRVPASRYVHGVAVSHVWAQAPTTAQHRLELLADIARNKPAAIVVDPWAGQTDPSGALLLNLSSFPELREILATEYEPPNPDAGSFQVFVRKSY